MIPACCLLWFALQMTSPEALQHLQGGVEADKQGHLEVAIAEFRKATELDPKLVEGFVDLGEAYMEGHDYEAAVPPLTHALELSPDLVPAHRLLGYALLSQGFPDAAIPHLERAHELAALGIAQIDAGQLQQAVVNLQEALAKRPDDQDLLYYFGRACGLLSKQTIDTLLAAYPDSARSHQALAENYFVLRQMPQAEKEFLEALRRRPDIPGLHLELGLVYAGASQWAKAEQEFGAELKLQPGNAEAAYRLGAALMQEGRARDARPDLQRADRLKPEMPETLYLLGKAAALDGDPAAAEKHWNKLLTIEKDGSFAAQAHFGLSGLYRKQGKIAEAEREMQEFEKLQRFAPQPQNPPN